MGQAIGAGLNGTSSALTYGSLADKTKIGYNVPNANGVGTHWEPVADSTVRLNKLSTENVLFEHLQAYGGENWSVFMTVITLVCIILYFITSSDSASYVVDIMAANGRPNPPVTQKVFWAFTEGAAAAALLASAGDDSPKAALNAVKALPIILGLPYTFLLFWMCQGLLIVCKEEAGALPIERKNFAMFIINLEPMSFLAMLVPFVPLGKVASKTWGGPTAHYSVAYGAWWFFTIALLCASAADHAFAYMAAAAYFMMGLAAAALRSAVRTKLSISGDFISDACACCFAFPCVVGQLAAEDFNAAACTSPKSSLVATDDEKLAGPSEAPKAEPTTTCL